MKRFIPMLVVAIVAATSNTYAQYAGDAVRFSQGNYGSTSRFKGLGNAQIGVGGDMSSLGGNPAGLGLITRSEFSFTPEFNSYSGDASYLGQNSSADKNKMNLNHIGVVWYNPTLVRAGSDTKKGVISTVLGIGYNRNNDFSQEISYGGLNTSNSFRTYLAEVANRSKDQLTGNLPELGIETDAFYGYLINYNADGSRNYSADPFANANQRKIESRAGSTSELNFSGAINISNQVYIGASVGLVNVRYISDAVFTEAGILNPYDPNDGYTGNEDYTLNFRQNQETNGSGVNGRLGVIVRPVPNFRIGATFQTPTWLTIDDDYSESISNTLTSDGTTDNFNNQPYDYRFSYKLRTPLKGSLGASYVLGNRAIIAADVDFVDYSTIRFSERDNNSTTEYRATIAQSNSDIRDSYKEAVNFRVGGEYRVTGNFNLRAGYGINGSPIKGDDDNDYSTKYYSGGVGYRVNQYYVDLAYQRVESTNNYTPYGLNDFSEPVATVKNGMNNVFLTLGVRF